METELKDKIKRICVTIIILIIVTCVVGGLIRQSNLNTENSLGLAKIYNCGARGKSPGFWIDYILETNGKQYKGSSSYDLSKMNVPMVRKYLIGKNFPAVYYPSNPSNSNILILPEDFEKYGYDFPDSLNWIKRLIEENKN